MRFGNMITTCVRHKISMSWLFAVQLILAVALSLSLVCSLSVCPLGFDTIEWRESWMCFGYEVLLLFDDCLISPIFSIFVLFVRLCFALLSRCFSFLFLFFSCFFFFFWVWWMRTPIQKLCGSPLIGQLSRICWEFETKLATIMIYDSQSIYSNRFLIHVTNEQLSSWSVQTRWKSIQHQNVHNIECRSLEYVGISDLFALNVRLRGQWHGVHGFE